MIDLFYGLRIADLMAAKELAEKLRDTLYRCEHCYTVSALASGMTLNPGQKIVECSVCHVGPRVRLVDWLSELHRI